jgi:hypothetical protein
MKNQLLKCFLVIVMLFGGISLSFADADNLWTCKTNASSAAPGSEDAQADMNMVKKPMEGNDAFGFAYQHCRDCTTISCSKKK